MKLEIEYLFTNDQIYIEEITTDDSKEEFIDSFWKKLNKNNFILISPLVVDKDKVRKVGPAHLVNRDMINQVRFFEISEWKGMELKEHATILR